MKIALAVDGTRGDVHPMLSLGVALSQSGHAVVVCAPPDFRDASEARGLAFRPVGTPIRPYMQERAAALYRGAWAIVREGQRYTEQSVRAQFETLPAAMDGADLVVAAGLQFAAGSVAEHSGAAYRYVAYCPVLFPSQEYPPFMVQPQQMPAWLNRGLWRGILRLQERQLRPFLCAGRAALGLPPVQNVYRHLLGPRPLLAADAELAPLPADAPRGVADARGCPIPVDQVPCLHPAQPGEAPLPAKLESFLAAGSAPVYLGFGSMTDADPAATTRAVLEAVERVGCRALLSAGWAGLGEGPLPEGVLTLEAVDHAALFPRVAAIVHHGGAGTTTTAARAGTPQIVVPHVLDQFYWGERVRRLGLGPPPLPRRRLDADGLERALVQTLENEILAERACEVGQRLRTAASLAPAVERLLAGF